MAKGQSYIQGIYEQWRTNKKFDAYRVFVKPPNKEQIAISPKVHPILKTINNYLKNNKMTKEAALSDVHFQGLKHKLHTDLKSEHGLIVYKAKEKLNLKRKHFNFEDSINEFAEHKSDTSVPESYKSVLINFWLPYFIEQKGCEHPKEFKQWKMQAKVHVKTAKKLDGTGKYSHNSYSGLTTPFNEYMRYLLGYGYIDKDDFFTLLVKRTLEEQKRQPVANVRTDDTYSLQELRGIKSKIDATFEDGSVWKYRAYVIYMGACFGLRLGNLKGLRKKGLKPNNLKPHIELGDNVVSGWSRGIKGTIPLSNSTKTTAGQVTRLPFVQPSKEIGIAVANYILKHCPEGEYLLDCYPGTITKWWKKIAKKCKFKFLHPHAWKHSYATIGALYLHKMYKGNPHFLQKCCLHESFRTTEKYINQKSSNLLEAFYDEDD